MYLRIDHIDMPVRDLDRSVEFYLERLGFYLQRRVRMKGDDREVEIAYVGIGDTLIELVAAPPDWPGLTEVRRPFALTVTDLDAALADLQAHGVDVVTPPFRARTFYGRQAVVADPDGYHVKLREWREPDGPHFDGWEPDQEGVTRVA